eukprot:jgi/Chlat1/7199/Chrsp57S06847
MAEQRAAAVVEKEEGEAQELEQEQAKEEGEVKGARAEEVVVGGTVVAEHLQVPRLAEQLVARFLDPLVDDQQEEEGENSDKQQQLKQLLVKQIRIAEWFFKTFVCESFPLLDPVTAEQLWAAACRLRPKLVPLATDVAQRLASPVVTQLEHTSASGIILSQDFSQCLLVWGGSAPCGWSLPLDSSGKTGDDQQLQTLAWTLAQVTANAEDLLAADTSTAFTVSNTVVGVLEGVPAARVYVFMAKGNPPDDGDSPGRWVSLHTILAACSPPEHAHTKPEDLLGRQYVDFACVRPFAQSLVSWISSNAEQLGLDTPEKLAAVIDPNAAPLEAGAANAMATAAAVVKPSGPNAAELLALHPPPQSPFVYTPGTWKGKTPKSHLHEWCQQNKVPQPVFIKTSPCPGVFTANCILPHRDYFAITPQGYYTNAKEAEQNASLQAIAFLEGGCVPHGDLQPASTEDVAVAIDAVRARNEGHLLSGHLYASEPSGSGSDASAALIQDYESRLAHLDAQVAECATQRVKLQAGGHEAMQVVTSILGKRRAEHLLPEYAPPVNGVGKRKERHKKSKKHPPQFFGHRPPQIPHW